MNPTIQITFDAADPDKLSRFWAEVLGYRLQLPPEGFASWEDWLSGQGIPKDRWNDASAIVDPEGKRPRIFFQRVSEAKSAKNRCHLDVNAGGERGAPREEQKRNVLAAVERALALGATKLYEKEQYGGWWVTLADPEGNEFCMQ